MAKRGKAKKANPCYRAGFDGRQELAPAEVESPYERGTFEVVVRNVRECSLSVMHARKQIDDAQLRAGEWLRSKIEQTRMSSGAIDPSYEPVDKSGHSDPIPDRVIMAAQAVAKARNHVGAVSWPLIELVCGQGATIAEAANRRYGLATEPQVKYTGKLLRETLDVLAEYLGYAGPRKLENVLDKRTA